MNYRVLTLALAALSASLMATATPITQKVTAVTSLTPGANQTNSDTYTGSPDSLNATAVAFSGSGNNSVFAVSETYNWAADGNSGTIMLQASWNLPSGSTYAAAEGTRFDYTFIADATGDFVLNYIMNLSGTNTFGLNGIQLFGDLGGNYFMANGGNGQVVASLIAGNVYSFGLLMNANLSGEDIAGFDGSLVGTFSFSMPTNATVPDTTATAGLLLASLASLAMLRRQFAR